MTPGSGDCQSHRSGTVCRMRHSSVISVRAFAVVVIVALGYSFGAEPAPAPAPAPAPKGEMPKTGGASVTSLFALGAGALLVSGGLLVRRIADALECFHRKRQRGRHSPQNRSHDSLLVHGYFDSCRNCQRDVACDQSGAAGSD